MLVSGGADKTVRVWDVLMDTPESSGKADAKAAQADGALTTKGASGTATTFSGKKKGVESAVSADLIGAFATKESPVYKVAFTRMNLVLAGGAYLPVQRS